MNKFLCLAVATLCLAVTFGASGPFGGQESSLLRQVCDNEKRPSKLVASLSELDELVQQVASEPCPDLIKSSIVHLANMIKEYQSATCSQESANAIAGYYEKYLAAKDKWTNTLKEYPKAMKPLFIAYGLRVSSFCRRQMIDLLGEDSQQLVGSDYFQELADYTGEKSFIAAFMDFRVDRNNLVMPDTFVKMMESFGRKGASGHEKERIYLEVPTPDRIKRLQSICEHRFEPIYKDLILPLVTLAMSGFNYKTEASSPRDSKVSKQVNEWYRVVFFCEAINAVEFFQTPQDKIRPASSSRRQVRLLEKEEADELRASQAATPDQEMSVERIDYHPEMKTLKLDNVVYDDTDSRLTKAVMAFRRRSRRLNDPDLVRRLINFGHTNFMRNNVKVLRFVTGLKSLPESGRMTSMDLVNLVSEHSHAVETGDLKALMAMPKDPRKYILTRYSIFVVLVLIICAILVGGSFVG